MKRLLLALFLIMLCSSCAFAEVTGEQRQHVPLGVESLSAEPAAEEEKQRGTELPAPYEALAVSLSNGKEELLSQFRLAAGEALETGAEFTIIERLGRKAAEHYKPDPLLGMAKACLGVSGYPTAAEQARALSAFARGFGYCGVAIIPFDGYDKEPSTKAQLTTGNVAWFVPFKMGSAVKINLYGSSVLPARIWKITPQAAVSKEWKPGFWEREVTIEGRAK